MKKALLFIVAACVFTLVWIAPAEAGHGARWRDVGRGHHAGHVPSRAFHHGYHGHHRGFGLGFYYPRPYLGVSVAGYGYGPAYPSYYVARGCRPDPYYGWACPPAYGYGYGCGPGHAPAAPPPPPQYSEDGKWWWTGTEWMPAPKPPPPPKEGGEKPSASRK